MTDDASLAGLRRDYIKSIYGLRLGLDKNDQLVGPTGLRVPIDGLTSGTSTVPSTSATLSNYGLSVIGTTTSSGTSVESTLALQMAAPRVGQRKTLFNISTAQAMVSLVTAAAFYLSTGSPASTYQHVTLYAKGASLDLIGLSTKLWGVLGNVAGATMSTNVAFI